MAGEARKAAERWLSKRFDMKHPDEEILTLNDAADLLIGYAAETREQCAQIADKRQRLAKEFAEKFDSVNMQTLVDRALADASVAGSVAAAIRSIAQQDSANEGANGDDQ